LVRHNDPWDPVRFHKDAAQKAALEDLRALAKIQLPAFDADGQVKFESAALLLG